MQSPFIKWILVSKSVRVRRNAAVTAPIFSPLEGRPPMARLMTSRDPQNGRGKTKSIKRRSIPGSVSVVVDPSPQRSRSVTRFRVTLWRQIGVSYRPGKRNAVSQDHMNHFLQHPTSADARLKRLSDKRQNRRPSIKQGKEPMKREFSQATRTQCY
ncbi:hypothetical protein CDAR_600151 [Caerostris darwini]|uniref:Uncharacterized protein n=1 Tax=Caerostris darwini TaxID=1538125 RepID=A0AAV4RU22_9ARAC|nr:hypothetical protein CDAR_600151 [Caerostris darwini]